MEGGNSSDVDSEDDDNTLSKTIDTLISNCKYYEIDEIKKVTNLNFKYTAIHINIHSLPSKFDQLVTLLDNFQNIGISINFVMLCETFLNSVNYDKFNIPGYNFIQIHRNSKKGGGVGIYIQDHFQFFIREDLSLNYDSEFESIFIEITNMSRKLIIGEIYRVPGTNELNSIERYETILQKFRSFNGVTVIGTDQNFNYMNANTHSNTLNLLNTFITAGFMPTITKPTRITYNTSTLIDNIYIRSKSLQNLSSGIISTYISDHLPIFMFIGNKPITTKTPITIKYRSLDNPAIVNIRQHLDNINWDIIDNLELNQCVELLNTKIIFALNTFAPEKTKNISSDNQLRQPWMTPLLLKESKKNDKLYKKKPWKAKNQHGLHQIH